MTDPDRTLARRAARGDRTALTRLYERHRSRLLGYLTRATGNPDLAQDLFQEVWFKVMRAIGSYRSASGPFRAWLYRIAHNAVIDRRRRDALRSGDELDAPIGDGDERRIDRVPSSIPDPERRVTARSFSRELSQALQALREEQRAAVLLRHQQGLTYAEIARVLRVPQGTAKSLIHRGVALLREQLEAWRPEGSGNA